MLIIFTIFLDEDREMLFTHKCRIVPYTTSPITVHVYRFVFATFESTRIHIILFYGVLIFSCETQKIIKVLNPFDLEMKKPKELSQTEKTEPAYN